MRGRGEWRAALAALSAMAGVGLASGREMALFFAQMKDAAWLGVLTASALYGLILGGAAWRGTSAFHMGDVPARVREILRLLLAALTAAFMLSRLGDVGALTLPMSHGYLYGAGFGLLAALGLSRFRNCWAFGVIVLLYAGLFYAAAAMDSRPARVYVGGAIEFELAGSVTAALLLALLYAALTACAASWSLDTARQGAIRPAALGMRSAGLLCVLLGLANLALLRGGDAVIAHPMPYVALSARWGLAGFWLCAGLEALCEISTLSAALGTIIEALQSGSRRAIALYMLLGSAMLFAVLSWGKIG